MKNNRLFSAPLFMENLRRYWVISLCFTMLYLVCGPISIAMESDPVYVVRMVLYELNPGFLLLMEKASKIIDEMLYLGADPEELAEEIQRMIKERRAAR